jgi:ubiquinone/menaquinone biosynthesis C-methylase UbiE
MKLKASEVEIINSLGPHNHSVWKKDGIVVTQEEVQEGRVDFLVSKIREIITKNYTIAEIKKMTIVDIGCYDGYILQQLADFPFKKMVGVEPRQKNIDKGKGVRKILKIKEKIHFKRSTLEELGNEKFDIVMCIGVLHHIESIPVAINKLNSICNKMMILENLCIPSIHITDKFKIDIEMKDVIYKNENLCGITGQKFESSYYDGSAASTSVISIPSIETMMMQLISLGHTNFSVAASPEDFTMAMKKNTRPSKEVLIYSLKGGLKSSITVENTIYNYEKDYMYTLLDEELVKKLYERYVLNKRKVLVEKKFKVIIDYIEGKSNNVPTTINNKKVTSDEIIKSLRYNLNDKISFEYAKLLYRNNELENSIILLEKIVQKINSDWRTCYRAFFLLSEINYKLKRTIQSKKYLKLCKSCNPDYPLRVKIR